MPKQIKGVGWATYGRDPYGTIFEVHEIVVRSSIWRLGRLRDPQLNVNHPHDAVVK